MIDYMQFTRGSSHVEVIERDITKERAKELEEEVRQFNKDNNTGAYWRGIMSDFVEK